jgi:hypothetical protein
MVRGRRNLAVDGATVSAQEHAFAPVRATSHHECRDVIAVE